VVLELYKVLQKFGYIDKKTREMPAEILKAVHDALYSEVPYEIVLIYVHVLQWVATYGVTAYYKEEFGVEFPIEPEIELEFGATEDKSYKWNWTDAHLKECLANTLKDQKAIGTLKEDPDEVLKKIYAVYDDAGEARVPRDQLSDPGRLARTQGQEEGQEEGSSRSMSNIVFNSGAGAVGKTSVVTRTLALAPAYNATSCRCRRSPVRCMPSWASRPRSRQRR
jgi:hypothetical protein